MLQADALTAIARVVSPQNRLAAIRAAGGTAVPEILAARSNLQNFTLHTYLEYRVNWHHRVMFEYLDQFIAGDIKRLMIFAPPRHGKSEIVSRRLPAYILGKMPDSKIISASYGADLARRMNRDVQRIIDSDAYERVFPQTRLFGSNVRTVARGTYLRNSDIFEVVGHDGYYRSSGVGGAITGMGMDYGIIDDPYKNRQDASSQTIRANVWDWYTSTFRTRLSPDGGILLTLTRWHEADLAARLLDLAESDPTADQWVVLVFPAVAENDIAVYDPRDYGDPLWPDRFDVDELNATRASLGTYEWEALYMQRPAPRDGSMFKRDWFEILQRLPVKPELMRFVRYWDKAGTKDAGAYTAGVLIGEYEGVYYIVDVIMGQWEAATRERIISQTLATDSTAFGHVETYIEQEPGSGGKESAESTIKNNPKYTVKADRPTGDKELRAEPFAAQCAIQNVKLLAGEWNGRYLDVLTSFPNGKIKDPVDASSGGFSQLAQYTLPASESIDFDPSVFFTRRR